MEKVDILLVDDDEIITNTLELFLGKENYSVQVVHSGSQALQILKSIIPRLMILDVMMPDIDGYQVCREVRKDKRLYSLPIIFLTAMTSDEDHIAGFKAGGDDYINKPFNPEVLILHVKAMLKRTQERLRSSRRNSVDAGDRETKLVNPSRITEPIIQLKGYKLNILSFELTLPSGKKLLLTPIQFDLLYNFMSHSGEIFSPSSLLNIIWDYPPDTGSNDLVRVHIKNLRMRIEEDPACPAFIETVPGYGYTVRPD